MDIALTPPEQVLYERIQKRSEDLSLWLIWPIITFTSLFVVGMGIATIQLFVNRASTDLNVLPYLAIASAASFVTLLIFWQKRRTWRREMTEILASPIGLTLQRKARAAGDLVGGMNGAYDAHQFFASARANRTAVGRLLQESQ